MTEFFANLHPVVLGLLKGLAVICVIFPIAGACSMAERKVSAWLQGRYGPNRVTVPWFGWIPFLGRWLQRLGVFNLLADGGKLLQSHIHSPALHLALALMQTPKLGHGDGLGPRRLSSVLPSQSLSLPSQLDSGDSYLATAS